MAMMMINGLTIPCAEAKLRLSSEEVGGAAEVSVDGADQVNRRATKDVWDCTTPPLANRYAAQLENWVCGRGIWHVSMDDGLCSENGLQARPGYGGQLTAAALFGTASWLDPVGGQQFAFRIPVMTRATDWSVSLWWYDFVKSAWASWVGVSRGGVATWYVNGAVNAAPAFVVQTNPTSQAIQFAFLGVDTNGAPVAGTQVDEVVMFNWPISDDMVAVLASGSYTFSATPQVVLSGDLVDPGLAETVKVHGTIDDESYLQGYDADAAAWDNAMRAVAFTLREDSL